MSKQVKVFLYVAAGVAAAILVAVAVLYAGSSKAKREKAEELNPQSTVLVKGYNLLGYIPSDAVSMMCADRLGEGVERIFSPDDIFRSLDYSGLENESMVVSYHYVGELIPMLVINAGRASDKKPVAVERLIKEAAAKELAFRYYDAPAHSGRRNVLMISPSENIISAAVRHIEERTSVLEAPGLAQALTVAPSKGDVYIIRNSAIDLLLEKNFLAKYLPKRGSIPFFKKFCNWTVLNLESMLPVGSGEMLSYSVSTYQPADNMAHYMNAIQAFPAGESKLPEIIPYGTTFAVDIPTSSYPDLMAARKAFMDASTVLDAYGRSRKFLIKATGHDPEHWAEELDIKEVARIYCRGENLLLVRPGVPQEAYDVKPFEYIGALSLLFGSVFAIPDETSVACNGTWLIIGKESAVRHLLASRQRRKLTDWPTKNVKCAVLADDYQLSFTAKGARLDVYRKY